MLELLLLLLPVAAASGWWAAKRSMCKRQLGLGNDANPVYFRGLNHLLNEEPDKAIDAFVEMLEVDSDTVETHLALGNLFRKRGEVERAIRLHQNLIARPALTREQRGQALLELGQDYMRAGLYDRAENLFQELKQSGMHVEHALRNLITIYQQERDWTACLEAAVELEKQTGESQSLARSHYYCELALKARKAGKVKEAQRYLKQALSVNKQCVRANHLLAKFAAERGDSAEVVRLLRLAVDQDPEYLPEVLAEFVEGCKGLGDQGRLRAFMEEMATRYPNRGTELYLSELIRQQDGEAAASDYLAKSLARTPSVSGLVRLVELQCSNPALRDEDLLHNVRNHLHRLLAERVDYQCAKCGFMAKTLHWQCPSCQSWSSIKRKPLLESENPTNT
jgi:lipopolysaccharide biosynthesis regulator YciM